MKNLALLFLMVAASAVSAQDYFYLEDVRLKKESDFTDNEANLVKAVDYMLSTPTDASNMDRKACTRFIIRYAEKHPTITILLQSYIIKVYDQNPDLLQTYMGLWVKHAIDNPTARQEVIEVLIFGDIYTYAKAGNNIVKTDLIKSLITAGDDDTIDEWLVELKKKEE